MNDRATSLVNHSDANFFDVLREHAVKRPDHPAIEDGERIVSYKELNELVECGAVNLRQAGITVGDVVAVMLENNADNLIVSCIVVRAGGVLFSLASKSARKEVVAELKDTHAAALISDEDMEYNFEVPRFSIKEMSRKNDGTFSGSVTVGTDPCIIVDSSGTTGAPKRFSLSHMKLLARAARINNIQTWTNSERYSSLSDIQFFTTRMYHFCILRLGATVVLPRYRSIDELVSFVNEKNLSQIKVTPLHLRKLLQFAVDKDLLFPNLRKFTVSSAPITAQERAAARAKLSPALLESYGTNETGTLAYSTPADQLREPESVGLIVAGVEGQIVDQDDVLSPPGTAGIARFRGADFATEYLNDPNETEMRFRDGWFYPGDIAVMNTEGFLFLKGRADDVIINAGLNVYPIEIENVLMKHPDVVEAAAFSWPHATTGGVPAACVIVKKPIAVKSLQEFCMANAPPQLVPKVLAKIDQLPRNAMGKILRDRLPDLVRDRIARSKREKHDQDSLVASRNPAASQNKTTDVSVNDWPQVRRSPRTTALALQWQFDDSERWPAEKLRTHQLGQAQLLLRHAAKTVPLYRDRIGDLNNELSLERFLQIPILRREDVQAADRAILSSALPAGHGKVKQGFTTGSTSSPVKIYNTSMMALFMQALSIRAHRWHGRDYLGRFATIMPFKGDGPFKVGQWAWLPEGGPSHKIKLDQSLEKAFEELLAVDPDYIQTRPRALLEFIRMSKATGRRPSRLKNAITFGEGLDAETRAEIVNGWDIEVFDNYSAEEFGTIAHQCPEGGQLHIQSESVICEIIGENGKPVEPGEMGEVVVTGLHNFAAPFIRYALGDYATRGPESCVCGRTLPIIGQVMGRTKQLMRLPDGRVQFPTSVDLTQMAPVLQFQIRQIALNELLLKLKVERDLTVAEEEALRKYLQDEFDYPLNVTIEYAEEMIRKPGAKYLEFMSDII
jgi:phenylacetate-CoA ligase